MRVTVDASQVDGLVADLERAERRVTVAAATEVQLVGGKVTESARRRVPKDSGDLAAAIEMSGLHGEPVTPTTTHVEVGPAGSDVFYGRFLEDGTIKMAPRPYLTPALTEHETELEIRVGRAAVGLY